MINRHQKSDYPFFYKLSTRWKDNDVYGHINNVVYYEFGCILMMLSCFLDGV